MTAKKSIVDHSLSAAELSVKAVVAQIERFSAEKS